MLVLWSLATIASLCFTENCSCENVEINGFLDIGRFFVQTLKDRLGAKENNEDSPQQITGNSGEIITAKNKKKILPVESATPAFRVKVYSFPDLETFNWTEGENNVPNNSVPFVDAFHFTPNQPDLDLVSEGIKVRNQILFDLGTLMWDFKRAHPLRVSPMRKVTFTAWKYDYIRHLDHMVDDLKRTRFFQYPQKILSWREFVMNVNKLFTDVSTKWVNKFLDTLPRRRKFWKKRLKDLYRRQVLFSFEIEDILLADKNLKGIVKGVHKRKEKPKKTENAATVVNRI